MRSSQLASNYLRDITSGLEGIDQSLSPKLRVPLRGPYLVRSIPYLGRSRKDLVYFPYVSQAPKVSILSISIEDSERFQFPSQWVLKNPSNSQETKYGKVSGCPVWVTFTLAYPSMIGSFEIETTPSVHHIVAYEVYNLGDLVVSSSEFGVGHFTSTKVKNCVGNEIRVLLSFDSKILSDSSSFNLAIKDACVRTTSNFGAEVDYNISASKGIVNTTAHILKRENSSLVTKGTPSFTLEGTKYSPSSLLVLPPDKKTSLAITNGTYNIGFTSYTLEKSGIDSNSGKHHVDSLYIETGGASNLITPVGLEKCDKNHPTHLTNSSLSIGFSGSLADIKGYLKVRNSNKCAGSLIVSINPDILAPLPESRDLSVWPGFMRLVTFESEGGMSNFGLYTKLPNALIGDNQTYGRFVDIVNIEVNQTAYNSSLNVYGVNGRNDLVFLQSIGPGKHDIIVGKFLKALVLSPTTDIRTKKSSMSCSRRKILACDFYGWVKISSKGGTLAVHSGYRQEPLTDSPGFGNHFSEPVLIDRLGLSLAQGIISNPDDVVLSPDRHEASWFDTETSSTRKCGVYSISKYLSLAQSFVLRINPYHTTITYKDDFNDSYESDHSSVIDVFTPGALLDEPEFSVPADDNGKYHLHRNAFLKPVTESSFVLEHSGMRSPAFVRRYRVNDHTPYIEFTGTISGGLPNAVSWSGKESGSLFVANGLAMVGSINDLRRYLGSNICTKRQVLPTLTSFPVETTSTSISNQGTEDHYIFVSPGDVVDIWSSNDYQVELYTTPGHSHSIPSINEYSTENVDLGVTSFGPCYTSYNSHIVNSNYNETWSIVTSGNHGIRNKRFYKLPFLIIDDSNNDMVQWDDVTQSYPEPPFLSVEFCASQGLHILNPGTGKYVLRDEVRIRPDGVIELIGATEILIVYYGDKIPRNPSFLNRLSVESESSSFQLPSTAIKIPGSIEVVSRITGIPLVDVTDYKFMETVNPDKNEFVISDGTVVMSESESRTISYSTAETTHTLKVRGCSLVEFTINHLEAY